MKKIMKLKWTKYKPDFECAFLTRQAVDGKWIYDLWELIYMKAPLDDTYYLALLDNEGDEFDPNELDVDGYLVINGKI